MADVISKKLYQFFVQVQSEYGLLKRLENHVDILLLLIIFILLPFILKTLKIGQKRYVTGLVYLLGDTIHNN